MPVPILQSVARLAMRNKSNILSIAVTIGYPPINIGVIYGIVHIDNWFLLSPAYLFLFGILAPLLVLIPLWLLAIDADDGPESVILPMLATVVVLLFGGLHFFVSYIASASV